MGYYPIVELKMVLRQPEIIGFLNALFDLYKKIALFNFRN